MIKRLSLRVYVILLTLISYSAGAQDTICVHFDTINVEQISVNPPEYRIAMFATNIANISSISTDLSIFGSDDLRIRSFLFDESIESAIDAAVISDDSLEIEHAFNSLSPDFDWPADQPLAYLTVRGDLINNTVGIIFQGQTAVSVTTLPALRPVKNTNVAALRYDPVRDVAGTITLPDNSPAEGVQLTLKSSDTTWRAQTDAEGAYIFSIPASSDSYELQVTGQEVASGRTQRIQGTNVGDIHLVYRHAAGNPVITDPLALAAADVNEDGTVNAEDGELIRAYTFLRIDAFTGSPHFRFLSREEVPRSTIVFANGIPGDQLIDFVMIKKGDVNFSGE